MKRLIPCLLLLISCSPASITRIGPTVEPRGAECEIEILDDGEVPSRPYRDVGVVSLSNCQDFRTNPCRKWLLEAACSLGGHVVYQTDEQSMRDGRSDMYAGPVTYRVLVGAYVAEMIPDRETDPVLNAEKTDCDAVPEGIPEEPTPERCTE